MAQATFSYTSLNIRATNQREEDTEWLHEFLVPWFESSDKAADVEVLVTIDPRHFGQLLALGPSGGSVNAFMMDTRPIEFPRWNAPVGQQAFYDDRCRLFVVVTDDTIRLVASEPGGDVRITLMRVLRELAMGIAQLRGGRFLHASAFVAGGRAVIIAGPRQAGKTSLLSYVLLHSQARFLGNDRLLVNSQDGAIQLRGMPTIVSIRDGMMDLFPGMRESIEGRCYSVRLTLAEAHDQDTLANIPSKEGYRGLSPRQFCSLMDCQPEREAVGSIVLFPRKTGCAGELELRRLSVREVQQRLQHCLLGHIRPDLLSDIFTSLPADLSSEAAPDDETLFVRLAESLPAYDCLLGNDVYRSDRGAKELLQLVGKSDPARQAGAVNTASNS